MIILITDRDNEIIKHLEEYKYCTIKQIEKTFFRHQDYSYNIASRRLKEIYKAGYIKIYRDEAMNRNVYVLKDDKVKPPSMHRILLLDIFAEMKYSGFDIECFKIEKWWMDGKIKSDAFTIFTVDKRRYHLFVEVHISNNPYNLEKYDTLYDSGDVQKFLNKDFFPKKILLVSYWQPENTKLNHCKVIHLNPKLDQFPIILLD